MPSAESQKGIQRPSDRQCVRFSANFTMNFEGFAEMSKAAVDFWSMGENAATAVVHAARALEKEYRRLSGFELLQLRDQWSCNILWEQMLDHLRETGKYDRCISLEDPLVRAWLQKATEYPKELKHKVICLVRSQKGGEMATLVGDEDAVRLRWQPLSQSLSHFHHILLKPE